MYHEIERKFLIRRMPKISGITPVVHERYFLQHGDLIEERLQKKEGHFEYEIKRAVTPHDWSRERLFITEEKFSELLKNASKVIKRESYFLSKKDPRLSIKKYQGDYRGLVYAQVEFDSQDDARNFTPLEWMGHEITNTPLGRESGLISLDRDHFLKLLRGESDTEV